MTGRAPHPGFMVFSHGQESSPDSRKIQVLRPLAAERGWRVSVPDYRGQDAPARVEQLLSVIDSAGGEPVALVGSSMGGVVSVLASRRRAVVGMFLLAPAVYYPGYEHLDHRVETPLVHILHGWRDEVIDPDAVIRFAREHRATLHLVDDDHFLGRREVLLERLFVDFLDLLHAGAGVP